jgi:GT2 family glycosyltransferase
VTELSVLVVNYNTWALCVEALRSLNRHRPRHRDGSPVTFEVIVVDNCSPRPDPQAQAELEKMLGTSGGQLILHERNGGYSEGINLAYSHSCGQYILATNPDVVFTPGCIDRLLRQVQDDPDTGVAVPAGFWDREMNLHLPPNTLPTMGDLLATTLGEVSRTVSRRYSLAKARECRRVWEAGDTSQNAELGMISGCCFLMERSFIDSIGLLDERFPLYFEDADLCVRVRKAGRRIVQVAGARLVHLYNQSGETDQELAMSRHWVSRRLFYRKWYGAIGGWIYRLCTWFPSSRLARRFTRIAPHGAMEDLGTLTEKPVIRLPRECDRFMLQVSMDARFYLSGAVFGDGDRWVPTDAMFLYFNNTVYFCRAFDLSGGGMEELMTYRFEVAKPKGASAGAESPLEGVHDRS